MSDHQLVRKWLAEHPPGHFDAASVQLCFLAAHKASGLDLQINLFRAALENLGFSPRCIRTGSTDRPALYRLSLPARGVGVTP